MAEIPTNSKVSTKVDMTPMVDLAFLLITFFMLTTSFNTPQAMEVNMPDKNGTSMPIPASRTITLLLDKDDLVYYYSGVADKQTPINVTDFSKNGIRSVLLNALITIREPIILIKPFDASRFRNVVDVLDEMQITGIERYAMVDATKDDLDLVSNFRSTE